MICRNCITGDGICVSYSDVYEDLSASMRLAGDRHWRGTGPFWVTVDQNNGVQVHHAQFKSDVDMAGLVCSLHLANEEWLKMQSQCDSYRPPQPQTIDPMREMMRQRDMLS